MEDNKDFLEEEILSLKLENLKLRGLLEEHLGQKITDEILAGKVSTKLGGEKKEVGILMADLRNFTSFSEKVEATRIVEFLNIFFKMTTTAVEKHNGFVDKFIGDAILAIFYSDNIPLMIDCSIEILEKFEKLPPPEGLGLGIGLSSGQVVMGYVGSGRKVDFTVIGPAVNLASRLSSMAKTGEILYDENIKNYIGSNDKQEFVGSLNIKGFSKTIDVYRIKKL